MVMGTGERCGVDAMVVCVRVNEARVARSNRALSVIEPVM